MNKYSESVIRSFFLKNDALLLSPVITLLIFITFLFISGFDYQIQNTEATSNTATDSSTLSDLIQKGGQMLNSSRYEEALVSFDRALIIDSMSVDALNGKGLVINQIGKYEESITWFDKALEINPDFTNALYNKGVTLSNLGKYEEAIIWFDKTLEINPHFVDAMYNKADALGELGKYEEALVWTDKALTLKPVTHNNSNSKDLLLPND
ncbi:MAG: tetratricopeptide repeat protein [Nitrososphaeraceae archaeon]|nr:tetratricopeptide repeat protein [Nitrososphaeraceae archaeon]MDW0156424.1 tetratricopeptide repeat protein [Nitrososphaeraceae archaeon]